MYRDRLRASPVFFSARNVTRKFISPVDAPRDRSLVFRRPGKSIVCLIGTLIAPPPSERLRIGTRQREENVASLPLINGPGINPDGGRTSLEEVSRL